MLDVYLAIDWLTLEYTDGRKRNKISTCLMHFQYRTFLFAAPFWGLRSLSKIGERLNVRVVQKQQQKKKRCQNGGGKKGKWGWYSGWAAWNINSQSVGWQGCVETKRWQMTGVHWGLNSHLCACHRLCCVKGISGCFLTAPPSCQTMHIVSTCMPKEECTKCSVTFNNK